MILNVMCVRVSVLEVCTVRNFAILPGPTLHEHEIYRQMCYPYPTEARLSLNSSPNKA